MITGNEELFEMIDKDLAIFDKLGGKFVCPEKQRKNYYLKACFLTSCFKMVTKSASGLHDEMIGNIAKKYEEMLPTLRRICNNK